VLPDALDLWLGHPSVVVGCLALLAGYGLLVGPLRARIPGSRPVPRARVASFVLGIAVMFAALTGPIHEYGDCCLFSVHMVQHLMVTLLMPPLVLYGVPGWALRPLSRVPVIGPLGRRVTRAAPAFAVFNLLFAASHLVPLYELQMRHHGFHIALHLAFMVTAVIMWWPVAGPADLPAWPRLSSPVALLYLFLQIVPGSLVGALIGLAQAPLYPWYAAAPRVAGLTALYDQQLGALLMWVGGGLFWLLALTVVFFVWSAKEEDDARGPLRGETARTPSRP
jgi:putative membrane protein